MELKNVASLGFSCPEEELAKSPNAFGMQLVTGHKTKISRLGMGNH
jgi:hypothetical protein